MEYYGLLLASLIAIICSIYYGIQPWFYSEKFNNTIKQKKTNLKKNLSILPDFVIEMVFYNNHQNIYLWGQRIGSLLVLCVGLFMLIVAIYAIIVLV